MPKKQFKTESKRILDLMINSVYTHKEIFLRELISNSSDALDKLYFRSLTDDSVNMLKEDYKININLDKDAKTLTISDNGCGMNADELAENLGVIAHSGTLDFKASGTNSADIEPIGQFGVGFYSAFMVASNVSVESRPYGSETSNIWQSAGVEGYTITAGSNMSNGLLDGEAADTAALRSHGTTITLTLKDDTDDEQYSEFLDPTRIEEIVLKYSDYIRYPIILNNSETPANSMTPLWKKPKAEITSEDYNSFYKGKFHDFADPFITTHYSVEGGVSYQALLFTPANAPFNFYSKDYQKGLQLYTNGVLIMDKCDALLPDHFSFVRGLIDSPDLSLNISRELLQHDRQLKAISKNLEKKIKAELEKLLADDRDKYEQFYKSFGLQLKYGLYANFGQNSEQLKNLVLFHSLAKDKLVTFSEYIADMQEDQKFIYYVSAETPAKAAILPQTERVREKGIDVLCLAEDVDEFALKMLRAFGEKEFKSVSGSEIERTDEEAKAHESLNEEYKEFLEFIQESLSGKVSAVKLSQSLGKHPVCLSSGGELSFEMEKVLSQMPGAGAGISAERILELNSEHSIFNTLKELFNADKDKLKTNANLLYASALLIEGLPIDNPVAFSEDLCSIM